MKTYVYCPNCGRPVNEKDDIVKLKELPNGWKKIFLGTVFEAFFIKEKLCCKHCINNIKKV